MHRPILAAARALALGALSVAAITTRAAAQLTTSGPATPAGPRVGILVGLSSATLSGVDAVTTPDRPVNQTINRRNGLVAGLTLALPVGTSGFSIRPELLYAQRGARVASSSEIGTPNGAAIVNVDVATDLDYVELPVLLQFTVPTVAGVLPSLYAGPSVAYLVRCRVNLAFSGTQESFACNDPSIGSAAPRKFDVSGVAGGQLGFDLGGQRVAVGARYTLGFTKLSPDADTKNRAFAVYGSVEFPFGR